MQWLLVCTYVCVLRNNEEQRTEKLKQSEEKRMKKELKKLWSTEKYGFFFWLPVICEGKTASLLMWRSLM